MKETINEIYQLIEKLGDNVIFDGPVVCKMTPHSKPEISHGVSLDTDMHSFSLHMLYSLRQRLRLMVYYKDKPPT